MSGPFQSPYTYAPNPSGRWELIPGSFASKKEVKQTYSLGGSDGLYGLKTTHDNIRPSQEITIKALGMTWGEVQVEVAKQYQRQDFTYYLKIKDPQNPTAPLAVVGRPQTVHGTPISADPKAGAQLFDVEVSLLTNDDVSALGGVDPNSF